MEICARANEKEDHQEEGLEFEDAEHFVEQLMVLDEISVILLSRSAKAGYGET